MQERHTGVLIIDEDADHAESIARQLQESAGRHIRIEVRPKLGLAEELLAADDIDLVFLDLKSAGSDPLATLKSLVARGPEVAIIAMLAAADEALEAEMLQAGAQDCLAKPVSNGELLARSVRYALERKQSQLRVQQYIDELERSNKELQEFAHVVSHDLKSPLSVISFSCALLNANLRDSLTDEIRETIQHIESSTMLMGRLIDDLLDYARLASSKRKLQPLDFNELFNMARETMSETIGEVEASVTHDDLPSITGDSTQIFRLFENLLDNAIKYRSQRPARIHLTAERTDDAWAFCLTDTGIGIPPEYLEKIFKVFDRGPADESTPGTGIGLALCKKIVELHGGSIWAQSEPDRGSAIHFTIAESLPTANVAGRAHSSQNASVDFSR